jgi:hypothetical protein
MGDIFMKKIYTIGSFSGWRDQLAGKLSEEYELDDPRGHSQSSIARLVTDDMNSAMDCPISLIYTPKGKRAGTMSYAELGAAKAMGNCIISVNENESGDNFVSHIANYNFGSFDEAYNRLNGFMRKDFDGLEVRDKTQSREPCNTILFTGELLGGFGGQITKEMDRGKEIIFPMAEELEVEIEKADLIVANFYRGHDENALFYMGAGYALKTPVIMLEGNSVPYPPLLGLARRVMVGEERFGQLDYYLENLKSQHVSDEAVVYYNLMKEFD